MTEHFIQKMEAALKFIPYPNLVMIFSLAAFLQENVRHARWGLSNQRVPGGPFWWKFHEGRMWSPPRPHRENKKEKKRFRSTIHLLVFTQGVLLAKPPMQSLQNVRL